MFADLLVIYPINVILLAAATSRTSTVDFIVSGMNNKLNSSTISPSSSRDQLVADALKDIAYYLRAHKFNEFDRRDYYKFFPKPPLRSLHWEVRKYCDTQFIDCVNYLHGKVAQTTLRRADEPTVIMHEQNTSRIGIEQVTEQCRKLRTLEDRLGEPFAGPLERFQWRVTASYYMCWYTMLETPQLEHFEEVCDNFAACSATDNNETRLNGRRSYSCAMYSFCPDPCCPLKRLKDADECWNAAVNPCFEMNGIGRRECVVKREQNRNFRDLVVNRWNVSCGCPTEGYVWNSFYGLCVDVDECRTVAGLDKNCEACINLPGTYRCVCKWGHILDGNGKCTANSPLGLIKLRSSPNNRTDDERERLGNDRMAQSILRRIIFKYRGFFGANSNGTTNNVSKLQLIEIVLVEVFLLTIIT